MTETLVILDAARGLVYFLPWDSQNDDIDSEEMTDALEAEGIDMSNSQYMVVEGNAFMRAGWSQ